MPSEQKDIVARLRDFASRICSVRGDTNLDNKAVLARAAADEIERLRAELVTKADELAATVRQLRKVEDERDEARRQLCNYQYREIIKSYPDALVAPQTIATARGWDCFKENKR
jgi:hypothetical protein